MTAASNALSAAYDATPNPTESFLDEFIARQRGYVAELNRLAADAKDILRVLDEEGNKRDACDAWMEAEIELVNLRGGRKRRVVVEKQKQKSKQ